MSGGTIARRHFRDIHRYLEALKLCISIYLLTVACEVLIQYYKFVD